MLNQQPTHKLIHVIRMHHPKMHTLYPPSSLFYSHKDFPLFMMWKPGENDLELRFQEWKEGSWFYWQVQGITVQGRIQKDSLLIQKGKGSGMAVIRMAESLYEWKYSWMKCDFGHVWKTGASLAPLLSIFNISFTCNLKKYMHTDLRLKYWTEMF